VSKLRNNLKTVQQVWLFSLPHQSKFNRITNKPKEEWTEMTKVTSFDDCGELSPSADCFCAEQLHI
jgi:uracil-DNA glycosylase